MNKKESTVKNIGLPQDQLYDSVGTALPKGLEMTVDMDSVRDTANKTAVAVGETSLAVETVPTFETITDSPPTVSEPLIAGTYESGFPEVDRVNEYVQELDNDYYAQLENGRKRGILGNLKLYAKKAVKSVKKFIDPMHEINKAVEEQDEPLHVKTTKDVVREIDDEYYAQRASQRQRGLLTNLKLHANNAWQGLKTFISPMKAMNDYADKMEAKEIPPMPAAPEMHAPSETISRKDAAKATFKAMSQLHDFYRTCSKDGLNIRNIDANNQEEAIRLLEQSPLISELPALLKTKAVLLSEYEKANDVLERVRKGETVQSENSVAVAMPTPAPVEENVPVKVKSIAPTKKSFWKRAGTALAAAAGIITAAFGVNDVDTRLNSTKLKAAYSPDIALPTVVAPVKPAKQSYNIAPAPEIITPEPVVKKTVKSVSAKSSEKRKFLSYDSLADRMKANRRIAVIKSRLGKSPSSGISMEVWSRASSMMDDATTYLHAADTSCRVNGQPGICPPDKGKTASRVVTEAYIVPVEKMLADNGLSLLR